MESKKTRRKRVVDVLVRGDTSIPPSILMFTVGLIRHWGDNQACRKALQIASVRTAAAARLPSWAIGGAEQERALALTCMFCFEALVGEIRGIYSGKQSEDRTNDSFQNYVKFSRFICFYCN